MSAWISVKDRLPDNGEVLAHYKNSSGKDRIIKAVYIHALTEECFGFDAIEAPDYIEEDDIYYYPEGWYEQIDNWGDYSACPVVQGDITHWMPLPEPPKENES